MEERLLALLRLALKYDASDIHFTLKGNIMCIQMRVQGKLQKIKENFIDTKLIRYLGYLAGLDMGNLRKPQTGQFEMEVDGILLSLRFATIDTVESSNGVLRILNSKLKVNASNLSSVTSQNDYFKSLLKEDCGLIIFSGPTGSGKTTALYSLLKEVKNKKIYTIEDPIEVYNEDFVQLQVNETAGFSYEEGVKQILRHDPDIVMVGEIRDEKAAKMAVVAANTGHLVLTTLHSSYAKSAISRLVEYGISSSHLYDVLLCIANQRMKIGRDGEKIVFYELMDKIEIEYFRKNGENSKDFLSLNKQIEEARRNGLLKED